MHNLEDNIPKIEFPVSQEGMKENGLHGAYSVMVAATRNYVAGEEF